MSIYSHDGLRDSLTQLAAPTLFYEELRRELARADRGNRSICLIRFVLVSNDCLPSSLEIDASFGYIDAILSFAQILARLTRKEDVCARMGVLEFVCILNGVASSAENFISRISAAWQADPARRKGDARDDARDDEIRVDVSSLVSGPGESALQLLERLDSEPRTGMRQS